MTQSDITDLLRQWRAGDKQAINQLIPAVYDDLRSVAHQRLSREWDDRSLNTTGLVHEAYLRFLQASAITYNDRDDFLAAASRVMRNVLVDHARTRKAVKRGGGAAVGEIDESAWITEIDLDRVSNLDAALTRLEQLNERQARMIEQRYFGGLRLEEIAEATHVSLATVKRDLRYARAWLAAELSDEPA
ncbi:MAG TPA: ECF-type sigma factor [Gemmatimonadaceae bacterium]|jgi:RNA polymerase sigma factor (TIGR02999 family)|nr:ECF-type sigma factor [Gemmatimonadaceae bacterium]